MGTKKIQRVVDASEQRMREYIASLLAPPAAPVPNPTPAPAPNTPTTPTFGEAEIKAAEDNARHQTELKIREQGLDPALYRPQIDAELARMRSNYTGGDPRSAFNTDIASPLLKGEEAKMRNQFLGQVNERFGNDYGQRNISSSLLDDTINAILGEQKGDAQQYLDRGKARGIYNDVGYNAGLAAVNNASSAGSAKLNSLGHDVIDKYRTRADSVRDKAYGAASGWGLGGTFSLDPYINQGNEIVQEAQKNAAGDLRNVFGGTKLFDFSGLTNAAGMAQGAVNLRDADVATALRERKRTSALGRGLGSQGAF